MKKILLMLTLALTVAIIASSCKKEVGEGGTATITGKVFGYDINANDIITDSAYVGGVRVYLSYGDNLWPDEDAWTSYSGDYAFQGLQKGEYRVFVYSQCNSCPFNQEVKVQYIEITSNGQTVVLPDFKIID